MFRFSLITLLVGLMASLCVDAFSHKPAIFVALTRIKNMNKQLSNRLIKDSEKFGRCEITCLELPCIECVTEEAVADSLRSSVRDQDAVLLTSPKAAKLLIERCDRADLDRLQLLTLGRGTSVVLQRAGLTPAFESSEPSGAGLSRSLPISYRDLRILYPVSALADSALQDGLRARGFGALTRLNVYTTINPVWSKSQRLLAESASCVTFTSPSTVQGWVSNGADTTLPCFVIGEKTRAAAERLGFSDIVHPAGAEARAEARTEAEGHSYSDGNSSDNENDDDENGNSNSSSGSGNSVVGGGHMDVIGQMSHRIHSWIARGISQ